MLKQNKNRDITRIFFVYSSTKYLFPSRLNHNFYFETRKQVIPHGGQLTWVKSWCRLEEAVPWLLVWGIHICWDHDCSPVSTRRLISNAVSYLCTRLPVWTGKAHTSFLSVRPDWDSCKHRAGRYCQHLGNDQSPWAWTSRMRGGGSWMPTVAATILRDSCPSRTLISGV